MTSHACPRTTTFSPPFYAEFPFNGVRIISRTDGLDSDDQHSKLGFQVRGIVKGRTATNPSLSATRALTVAPVHAPPGTG
jgi:hypothetical protein